MKLKALKWLSTSLALSDLFLTKLNIYHLNIFLHRTELANRTIAGIWIRDKAIITDFQNKSCA